MSYRDAALPISARVADLLGRMTLDEKLAQLVSCWARDLLEERKKLSTTRMDSLLGQGIGQITRLGGSSIFGPAECASAANQIQAYLVNHTRLGIPAIIHDECCAGFMSLGGTIFPQMIGLAGTFQPELAEEMSGVIRTQMRAAGVHQGLAPVLDVARDPRWGRVEETFGEDPTLVSQFGAAYIRGLQGPSLMDGGVIATGKHFIGHSASQSGMNCAPVHLGERELLDVFIAPFQAAIQDGKVQAIMNAYPELDGEVVAASSRILTDLLRRRLGFDGLIVADYEAIRMLQSYHHVAEDKAGAAILALQAGIEVELPEADCYQAPLKKALEDGRLQPGWVDAAVSHHLAMKFKLGLFENPFVDEKSVVEVFETPDQREKARNIASKSMTLLKNDGILPLPETIKSLAVIGPNANSRRNLLGAYSYIPQLEYMATILPPDAPLFGICARDVAEQDVHIPSILEKICESLPNGKVQYACGCDNLNADKSGFDEAQRVANMAEVVILILGDHSGLLPDCTAGETRDSADLALPGVQAELAQAIFNCGKPVILVLVNGRPLAIPEIVEKSSAVLEAWLPGEEGGEAIADILFGRVNPGGRLPMSFPRHVGQVPIFHSQKPSGGNSNWYKDYVGVDRTPLFPFGHGLSYTSFEYSHVSISPAQAAAGHSVQISLDVQNCGKLAGDEVVQLYTCDEIASIPRPVKELRGFIRLSLQPGETRRVVFHLPVDQLAFHDSKMDFIVEPGKFKVMIGSSSEDIRCEGEFEIAGTTRMPVERRVFTCPVEVGG